MVDARTATSTALNAFALACPGCRSPLDVDTLTPRCASCGEAFLYVEGIWRFLPETRYRKFAPFLEEYRTVRAAEGWGRPDVSYFQSLPSVSRDDPLRGVWQLRARGYQAFLESVIIPLEAIQSRPLTILDLGAGNGWLAHRLATRGHRVLAVDLSTDALDGLGAFVWYDREHYPGSTVASFVPVQAEFDRLPLAARQVDLVVFNGSFHYSIDYAATLREARRVLRADGQVVILDTPFYTSLDRGAAMVHEREARFERVYGFKGDRLPTEGYLTSARLRDLGAALDLSWRIREPSPGWQTVLHRWRARVQRRREPATFPLAIGRLGHAPPPRVAFPRLVRAAARFFLRSRRRLLQSGRYNRLVLELVHGVPILVLPGVFNPKLLRTGEFLVQVLATWPIPPGSTVLDLGTGSGVGAVLAGRRAGRVVAVDINPEAVRCARLNLLLHHLEGHCEAREGDLFGPVAAERFDLILFNPPFFRGEPRDALDHAWRGTDVIERFAAQLCDHLTPDGAALVILSSDGEAAAFLDALRANGLIVDLVAWRDLVNEALAVYQIKTARPESEAFVRC